MAGRGLAPVALTLFVLVSVVPSSAHHADDSRIEFYVHEFKDGEQTELATLAPVAPGPEVQSVHTTCTSCTGSPSVTYVFRTRHALPNALAIDGSRPHFMEFWIRAYQSSGVTVYPLDTRVTVQLRQADGVVLGEAWNVKRISDGAPYRYQFMFTTLDQLVPAGTHLEYRVTISNPGGYNPAAAPYGGDLQHPFRVQLAARWDLPGPRPPVLTMARTDAGWPSVLRVGTAYRADFRVENQGTHETMLRFLIDGLDPDDARVDWPPMPGAPGAAEGLWLDVGQYVFGNFSITPQRSTLLDFRLGANGSFGEGAWTPFYAESVLTLCVPNGNATELFQIAASQPHDVEVRCGFSVPDGTHHVRDESQIDGGTGWFGLHGGGWSVLSRLQNGTGSWVLPPAKRDFILNLSLQGFQGAVRIALVPADSDPVWARELHAGPAKDPARAAPGLATYAVASVAAIGAVALMALAATLLVLGRRG